DAAPAAAGPRAVRAAAAGVPPECSVDNTDLAESHPRAPVEPGRGAWRRSRAGPRAWARSHQYAEPRVPAARAAAESATTTASHRFRPERSYLCARPRTAPPCHPDSSL